MRIGAISLGCDKNRVDTEKMLSRLVGGGHTLVGSEEEADVIIVNTCALAWYSTIVLHQPYPLESLSSQLGVTIIGAIVAKVLGNIFEHNNGGIFGQSDNERSTYTDE